PFRRNERLGENTPDEGPRGLRKGISGIRGNAESGIELGQHRAGKASRVLRAAACSPKLTEPAGECWARQIIKLADAAQAESLQKEHGIIIEAEGLNRKLGEGIWRLAGRRDGKSLTPEWSEASQRSSGNGGIGEACPHGQPEIAKAADKIGH